MNQSEITKIITEMLKNGEADDKIIRTLIDLGIDVVTAQQLIAVSRKTQSGFTRVVSSRQALSIDTYPIESDNVKLDVSILQKPEDFVLHYYLNFPEYGEGTKALLANLKRNIISEASFKTDKLLDPKFVVSLKEKFRVNAERILKTENPKIDENTKRVLIGDLIHEMLGLGKIEFLLADGNLEEIVVNSAKEPVWVYSKKYGWLKTNVLLSSEEEIQNFASIIARRVGKQITILNPLLDAHLITGDRANSTLFPISSAGNTLTIRRFRRDPWTVTDFIKTRTVNSEIMALMWLAMQYELNIIISGGTASGKCVSGNSKVLLSNQARPIKEIVEEELAKGDVTRTEDGFYSASTNLETWAFNPRTAKMEKKPISRVWKRTAPEKMVRITTQTGKQIEVTPEHPFFILNGELEKKKAGELVGGEFIPAPRKLNITPSEPELIKIPFLKHLETQSMNGKKLYRPYFNSNKWVKLPSKMSCELARFIGYVLGDGHITKNHHAVRFFNLDSRLREDFKQCGETLFGIDGRLYTPKNRCPYIEFNSKVVGELLVQSIGISSGKKSNVISIPKTILYGDIQILKECIRGLFESEASVEIKKGELEFGSASEAVVEDLSTALHRFGIIHRIKKYKNKNRLFITGSNLQKFGSEIGFLRPSKNDLILRAQKKTFSPNLDFVPHISPIVRELKKKLRVHTKEMRSKISREAVARYLAEVRAPTRGSLKDVATSLERRYDELCKDKQLWDETKKLELKNRKLIHAVQNVYHKMGLEKKKLARRADINPNSLWMWETNRTIPTPELVLKLAQSTVGEFDSYYSRMREPINDLQTAHEMGLDIRKVANEVPLAERTLYKYVQEKAPEKITQILMPFIREWQKNQCKILENLHEEVFEIKKIIQAEQRTSTSVQAMALSKKLQVPIQLKKSEKVSRIDFILNDATSIYVKQKIDWLKNLAESEVLWDKIVRIETFKPSEPWVYDLTVDTHHTFVANNLVAHNTSLMNVLVPFIQPNHRILTIEDTRELQLPEFLHWVPMTTREPNPEGKGGITMLDLLVNSLRMRPDRLIVGETRRQAEAEVMFEGMHTGHSVYTTFHANTAEETIRRMTNPPINIPTTMMDAVHLNIVQFRNRRLGVRRVLQIAEFIPEKHGTEDILKANTLYRWRPSTDTIEKNADSIRLNDELGLHTGLSPQEITQDLKKKQSILDWMVKHNIHEIGKVGHIMAEYYMNEEEVLEYVQLDDLPDFAKVEDAEIHE